VSTTNGFRRAESEHELRQLLLDEIEDVINAEGPETIAMMIAEPVQNSGGCIVPPIGYWTGLRELCDRYGILLVADEVITGFGRLGEWFGSLRYDAQPDLITVAKGITAAYAPMGAVLVGERVTDVLCQDATALMHGVTFGGHPLSAAIALCTIDIIERDGVLENVRANEAEFAAMMEELRSLPIVGDVRGAGYFWAVEMVPDGAEGRFDAEQRERMLRGYLPGRLLEAGLIARGDDRGDAVVQVAPPLICDRPVLGDLVTRLGEVLADVGEHMGVRDVAGAV
jgi:adenosylmethionine-8-amino-7-oxononanoate aminotransferase